MPRAKAGSGDVHSYTLNLKCYKNCGAKDTDFKRSEEKRRQGNRSADGKSDSTTLMKAVREKLPDIFDAAGMKDMNDENTKEILRLLIGGHIPSDTNMTELVRLQEKNGLGYLPLRYRSSRKDYKMSMVVFACSCTSPVPYNQIKCVREVLQEVDPFTSSNKFDTDVFLLITKLDMVQTDMSGGSIETIYSHTNESPNEPEEENENEVNETERPITIDHFKEVSKMITEACIQTGTATHNQLHWASYNDTIGYDNVYVDNKSLKLLKVLTMPLHTDEAPPLDNPTDSLNRILVDLLFGLRRALGQNIQLSHVVMYLAAIVLIVAFPVWGFLGDVRRN